ncbi:hypothetical protein ABFV05_000773 [Capra hircus]
MGNQLAGIAPSQILSVESYFSDIHDFEYDKSLGSTRFFKVARAKHREGLVVVKVFAIQDPTLPLTSYKQELEELKIRLHSAQNCLPFQKAAEKASEKAAMLFRQYLRDNLYDRISTLPFLNNIEKRWIAFQILTAVDQAHKSGVRHGDIKTEKVSQDTGCVIAELFTEGVPLFDLSQLLAYRNGQFFPEQVLSKIEDRSIRELVTQMIHREPDKRLEAEDYLKQQRGNAFPEIVYTFLQPYMADERILVIRKDLDNIIHNLCGHDLLEKADGEPKENGLVILVSVITSCLQTLKYCDSKLAALELILHLARRLSVEILLDRITPYLLHFSNDSVPRVRAEALRTLTKVLALVKEVPRNDVNIYPEYILPGIAHLAQDDATIVRLAYPENIALLAETALRFLELVQLKNLNVENDPNSEEIDELQALHEMVQQKVVTLLSDPENIVKQPLMENGITRLCVFFGRQKASDVLLSHMITFLNDKNDWHLRGAFFDSIVGLSDAEEFVIVKALNALTCMCQLGLLQKPHIRYGAVGFITVVAHQLSTTDVYCKLLPYLDPYITQPIIQGMTEEEEEKLLALKDFMMKSNKAKANIVDQSHLHDSSQKGVIDLAALGITGRQVDLVKTKQEPDDKRARKHGKQDSNVSEEWKSMFGSLEPPSMQQALPKGSDQEVMPAGKPPRSESSAAICVPLSTSPQVPEVTNVQNRKPTVQVFSSTILPSTSQIRITTCKAELQQLIQQKREQCSAERIAKQMMGNAEWESKPPPPGACAVEGRWYSSPGAWAWNPVEETGDSYRQRK